MAELLRPQQVAAGVDWFPARTPTLPPATHTNSYALGGREVLLVEPATPFDDERAAWLDWARGLVSAGREIKGLFITHHHPDHVGGAAFLSQALGIPLWAHEQTAQLLDDLPIERLLADGDLLRLDGPAPQAWRCLHTPGHAPGHLCLFEETQRTLIVGDMVASEGTILIAPDDGDLQIYLQQLARLRDLNAVIALPAHGAPIEDANGKFEHYIAHRLMREERVYAALLDDPKPLSELVKVVYADVPEFLWPLAAISLESHLIKLIREGRAALGNGETTPETKDVRRYRRSRVQ